MYTEDELKRIYGVRACLKQALLDDNNLSLENKRVIFQKRWNAARNLISSKQISVNDFDMTTFVNLARNETASIDLVSNPAAQEEIAEEIHAYDQLLSDSQRLSMAYANGVEGYYQEQSQKNNKLSFIGRVNERVLNKWHEADKTSDGSHVDLTTKANREFVDSLESLMTRDNQAIFENAIKSHELESISYEDTLNFVYGMEQLRGRGVGFTIQANNGQISALLDNRARINLTGDFCGSVYRDSFTFVPTNYTRSHTAQGSTISKDLIDYALGIKPLPKGVLNMVNFEFGFDNDSGTNGKYKIMASTGSSFSSGRATHRKDDNGNEVASRAYNDEYIRNNSSLKPYRLAYTSEKAQERLQTLVDEARNSYFNIQLNDAWRDKSEIDGLKSASLHIGQHYLDKNPANKVANGAAVRGILQKAFDEGATNENPGSLAELRKFLDTDGCRVALNMYNTLYKSTNDTVGTGINHFNPSYIRGLNSVVTEEAIDNELVNLIQSAGVNSEEALFSEQDETAKRDLLKFKDLLVQYDKDSGMTVEMLQQKIAQTEDVHEKARLHSLISPMQTVSETLESFGVRNAGVSIDKNGIIRWHGDLDINGGVNGSNKSSTTVPIYGDVGQIFGTDDRGLMKQEYRSSGTKYYVPGIKGYYDVDGENKNERLRLLGSDEQTRRMVRQAVAMQLVNAPAAVSNRIQSANMKLPNGTDVRSITSYRRVLGGRRNVGKDDWLRDFGYIDVSSSTDSTRVNELYKRELYGTIVKENLISNDPNDKRPQALKDAIIREYAATVRFDKSQEQDTNTMSVDAGSSHSTAGCLGSLLVDEENIRISSKTDSRWFDDVDTGNGRNQGAQRVLRNDVFEQWRRLGEPTNLLKTQGFKQPNEPEHGFDDPNGRSPLRTFMGDSLKFSVNDPFDRTQMASSQLKRCSNITKGNVVMATFGGWTSEDSCVVSKKFAESHMIDDGTGHYRKLEPGDKLSDMHGNKSVISLVVDPDLDTSLPDNKDLKREVAFFKQNPDLDIVVDPETVLSRQNTGLIHEAAESANKKECKVGNISLGTMCEREFIVTDEAVDKNEHTLGSHGSLSDGRKTGAFYSSVLAEGGTPKLAQYMFGDVNDRAWHQFSDELKVLNMKLEGNGKISVIPSVEQEIQRQGRNVKVYDLEKEYAKFINSDENDPNRGFGKRHELSGRGILGDAKKYDAAYIKLPVPVNQYNPETNSTTRQSVYVPILSSAIEGEERLSEQGVRNGKTFSAYSKLIQAGLSYCKFNDILQKNGGVNCTQPQISDGRRTYRTSVVKYTLDTRVKNLQTRMNIITRNVCDDLGGLNGERQKYSIQRQKLMKVAHANSATMVAHANPKLDLGTIMINGDTMKKLHINEGDTVMMHRDPMQDVGNLRAMRVVEATGAFAGMHGVGMNPIECASFDGDFDGDKYGIIRIPQNDPELMAEVDKWRPENCLLDHGYQPSEAYARVGKEDPKGTVLNIGPELVGGLINRSRDEFKANDKGLFGSADYTSMNNDRSDDAKMNLADYIESKVILQSHEIEDAANEKDKQKAFKELSDELNRLQNDNYGGCQLNCDSWEHARATMNNMVVTGAKGSPKKLEDCENFFNEYKVKGHEKDMRDVQNGIQNATGIKTDYTGISGTAQQRMIAALRDLQIPLYGGAPKIDVENRKDLSCASGITIANQLGKAPYQNTLQAKHDADDALVRAHVANKVNAWLSGCKSDHSKYENVSEFIQDGKDLFIGSAGAKVDEVYIEALANFMCRSGKPQSIEQASAPYRSACDNLCYGNGVRTLGDMACGKLNNKVVDAVNNRFSNNYTPKSIRKCAVQLEQMKRQQAYGVDNVEQIFEQNQIERNVQHNRENEMLNGLDDINAGGQPVLPQDQVPQQHAASHSIKRQSAEDLGFC